MTLRIIRHSLRWGSLLLLLLLTYQTFTMRPATRELWAIMFSRLELGYFGVGYWDGEFNEFDFSRLEPGDLVLGGNTGSSWGHWTHAALYLGDGMVMDTFLQTGVAPRPVTAYNEYYSHAGALRVKLPREVKEKAVARARSLQGKPFYLLAPRGSTSLFYCTKVVWFVYKELGYDLDPAGPYWVVPDRIARSPLVEHLLPVGGVGQ